MDIQGPIVISLGGSLIVPDDIDTDFLTALRVFLEKHIATGGRFVVVSGGGKTTRRYQSAARTVNPKLTDEDLDWLGLRGNHFNGYLLHYMLKDISGPTYVGDPREVTLSDKPVTVVGGGWKPGATSDNVTVEVAHAVGATTIVNLSNITHVYSDDPKKDSNAKKLSKLSWDEYRNIIPKEMSPGLNTPFDPVASVRAQELGLTVVVMGSDLHNLEKYIAGEDFGGSVIS